MSVQPWFKKNIMDVSWFWSRLTGHMVYFSSSQECQNKCREEIKRVIGDSRPEVIHMQQLPYTMVSFLTVVLKVQIYKMCFPYFPKLIKLFEMWTRVRIFWKIHVVKNSNREGSRLADYLKIITFLDVSILLFFMYKL